MRTATEEQTILRKVERHMARLYRFGDRGHDITHPERMLRIAEKIADPNEVNMFLLKIAILCHDIHRVERLAPSHERVIKIAKGVLQPLNLSPEEMDLILDAVRKHDNLNDDSDSPLLIYLKDVDRLDMGAIGVLRIASHMSTLPHYNTSDFGENNALVRPQDVKSQIADVRYCLNWEIMLRSAGAREFGKQRFAFMRQFLDQAKKELEELNII